MKNLTRLTGLLVSSLALSGALIPLAHADDPAPEQAPCPWMQDGHGMGPGMMGGGYGMNPGMMGSGSGYGMGPGMMGGGSGYGMGPGMMGGYGMGSLGALDLTEAQQKNINQIQDETRKKHWELMGKMMDEQARLRDLYAAPKRDSAAIDNANKTIGQMQQQMYESSVNAHQRIEAVLTKEQQEKLKSYWRKGRY